MQKEVKWFESWFASPFYHLLYKDRDDSEADAFMHQLINHLEAKPSDKIHDVACGAGRHSIALNKMGFTVHGSDLSAPSIETALESKNDTLSFSVEDMRKTSFNNEFDLVFNLFTSFGYFEDLNDNLKTLQAFHQSLKPNGILVIDFMNAVKVVNNLVREEIKQVENTTFSIKRFVENGIIHKNIQFEDNDNHFEYEEKVQAITYDDFLELLKKANFKVLNHFGNYQLDAFDKETSDRLIIIAQK